MRIFQAFPAIIGKKLIYVGPVTGKETEFIVSEVKTALEVVSERVYGDLILISNNGTHYSLLNDTILWK